MKEIGQMLTNSAVLWEIFEEFGEIQLKSAISEVKSDRNWPLKWQQWKDSGQIQSKLAFQTNKRPIPFNFSHSNQID